MTPSHFVLGLRAESHSGLPNLSRPKGLQSLTTDCFLGTGRRGNDARQLLPEHDEGTRFHLDHQGVDATTGVYLLQDTQDSRQVHGVVVHRAVMPDVFRH